MILSASVSTASFFFNANGRYSLCISNIQHPFLRKEYPSSLPTYNRSTWTASNSFSRFLSLRMFEDKLFTHWVGHNDVADPGLTHPALSRKVSLLLKKQKMHQVNQCWQRSLTRCWRICTPFPQVLYVVHYGALWRIPNCLFSIFSGTNASHCLDQDNFARLLLLKVDTAMESSTVPRSRRFFKN